MLEKAHGEELDRCLDRAEKLALGHDPSRAHTLGWIENRRHFPKRSIPLLEYAGLRNELIAFYRDMQKALPLSDIPPKVLAELQAR